MPSYANFITAIGTIAIRFVVFRRRRSLLIPVVAVLVSGCGGNDAPHSHVDTTAVAPPPTAASTTDADSSLHSLPPPPPMATGNTVATDSLPKKHTSAKSDPVRTTTASTEKKETPAAEVNAKSTAGAQKKGEESSGCAEATPDLMKQGRMVFIGQGNCASCHGVDGKGNVLGPDLTDGKWLHISGDYASIAKIVRTGVNLVVEHSTPMPPMGGARLKDEEICAVAAYVRSLSH